MVERLVALRPRSNSTVTATDWRTVAEQVASDLENLNCSTERDFLAVGGKLTEFRAAAREISSETVALTELISGEKAQKVSRALDGMLGLSRQIDAQTGQSGQAMESVSQLSRRIVMAFSGLRNTVSIFRVMCTLTRIETSRLGSTGAGFGDLADEVRKLAESIQSSGERVVDASSQLSQDIQSALRSGAGSRVRQIKELPGLIAAVMDGLRSFEERQQEAHSASSRQTAQYQEVGDVIDNLVTCLQFHDITRQQIEHVIQVLRQIGGEFPNGRRNRAALPPNGPAVLALQSSQLAGAQRVFASSLEHIERDLESIRVRLQDMSQASRALMGISEDEQDSFFLRMEACLTAILQAFAGCAEAQTRMQAAAATLAAAIARMRDSVADIRGIEIQIQRLALNATIRSVHIGAAGNALGVIAEVMQGLASESNRNTEDVAGALDAMSDAARLVAGPSDPAAAAEPPGATATIDGLRAAILELHSSSEHSYARICRIADLGSRLGDAIGELRGGLSASRQFAQVVNRACRELERIGAAASPAASPDAGSDPSPGLEDFAHQYTMQMERDVHESVTRGTVPVPAPGSSAVAALPEDGLGDNVELF